MNRFCNRDLKHALYILRLCDRVNLCLKFRKIVAYNSPFSEFGVPPWHAYAK
jgi:hypothetical protein